MNIETGKLLERASTAKAFAFGNHKKNDEDEENVHFMERNVSPE